MKKIILKDTKNMFSNLL